MKGVKHDVTQHKGYTLIHSFHSGNKGLMEKLMNLKGSIKKDETKDESEDSDKK